MVEFVRNCPSEFKEYYIQMQVAKRSQAPLPSQVSSALGYCIYVPVWAGEYDFGSKWVARFGRRSAQITFRLHLCIFYSLHVSIGICSWKTTGWFWTNLLLIKSLYGRKAKDWLIRCSLIMIVLEKLVLTIKLEMFLSARFLDTFMVRVTIAHSNLHLLFKTLNCMYTLQLKL